MTEQFDLYIEQLLSSFGDLPEDMPYGFWVSPHGKIYSVSYMNHNKVAIDIITQYEPRLNDLFENDSNTIKNRGDFLNSMGYLRLNIDEYNCYIDCTYYPTSASINIRRIKPTRLAERTAKDIADFYKVPVKYI